jgi:predicted small secreted protein
MIGDASFMSGVCCGAILGAAAIALVVSLLLESEQRKNERALRRIRKLWEE